MDGQHPLLQTEPPVLAKTGEDTWAEDDFAPTPLNDEEVEAVCEAVDPRPGTGAGTQAVSNVNISTTLDLEPSIRRMLRVSIASSRAVMLVEPPGTGKTELSNKVDAHLVAGDLAVEMLTERRSSPS